MTREDYVPPFEPDDDRPNAIADAVDSRHEVFDSEPDPQAASDDARWDHAIGDPLPGPDDSDPELARLAEPFVGQWNRLISTTNWEKGRIIGEWRQRLIETGAPVTEYSDEAWARRVGGVTAPHVGRLRRVFDRFGSTFESYEGLYWSHFLAAIDWDDSPLWLEGASKEGWSVSQMRERRWEALGAVESQRPTSSQLLDVDTDEDVVLPAQGGGREAKDGADPDSIGAGKTYDEPDFGEGEFGEGDELMSLGGTEQDPRPPSDPGGDQADAEWQPPVQPFAGLPELPDDLADAVEQFKLAVLRHKTSGWTSVSADTVRRYLDAMGLLLES